MSLLPGIRVTTKCFYSTTAALVRFAASKSHPAASATRTPVKPCERASVLPWTPLAFFFSEKLLDRVQSAPDIESKAAVRKAAEELREEWSGMTKRSRAPYLKKHREAVTRMESALQRSQHDDYNSLSKNAFHLFAQSSGVNWKQGAIQWNSFTIEERQPFVDQLRELREKRDALKLMTATRPCGPMVHFRRSPEFLTASRKWADLPEDKKRAFLDKFNVEWVIAKENLSDRQFNEYVAQIPAERKVKSRTFNRFSVFFRQRFSEERDKLEPGAKLPMLPVMMKQFAQEWRQLTPKAKSKYADKVKELRASAQNSET